MRHRMSLGGIGPFMSEGMVHYSWDRRHVPVNVFDHKVQEYM